LLLELGVLESHIQVIGQALFVFLKDAIADLLQSDLFDAEILKVILLVAERIRVLIICISIKIKTL